VCNFYNGYLFPGTFFVISGMILLFCFTFYLVILFALVMIMYVCSNVDAS